MKSTKKRHIALWGLCMVLFMGCGGGGEDPPVVPPTPPPTENQAPSVPALVFPTNGGDCTNISLELKWNPATDPEGDPISYVVEIATSGNFSPVLFSATTSEAARSFDLEKGTAYHWRVRARDNKGNESAHSPVHTFFTEPEAAVNHVPQVPEIVSPALGATVREDSAEMKWKVGDSDNDPLRSHLYFGTENPPPSHRDNLETTTEEVTVEVGKAYYWRIVVRDDKGGVAIGPVWSFRVE
ncbi:fibronectin type III domain-containing protein [Flavobacteriaceae bacterium 3-367]